MPEAIKSQPPAGGCSNCGAPRPALKGGVWLCAACRREDKFPPIVVDEGGCAADGHHRLGALRAKS
jgi:hypothetical protein